MPLTAAQLTCRRAGRLVFAGVSFSIGPGDALAITGRNGAGKSTLIEALAGLVRLETGTVRLSEAGERSIGDCIHYLGHRDGAKTALSVEENLGFAASCLGRTGCSAPDALARVGLARLARFPTGFLSAGQRRRLALARLLVTSRPLWLLDEPTTALDRDGQALLSDLMDAHRREGGMIVAATHAPLPLPGAGELELAAGRPR